MTYRDKLMYSMLAWPGESITLFINIYSVGHLESYTIFSVQYTVKCTLYTEYNCGKRSPEDLYYLECTLQYTVHRRYSNCEKRTPGVLFMHLHIWINSDIIIFNNNKKDNIFTLCQCGDFQFLPIWLQKTNMYSTWLALPIEKGFN